jgi:hypothetical protein
LNRSRIPALASIRLGFTDLDIIYHTLHNF